MRVFFESPDEQLTCKVCPHVLSKNDTGMLGLTMWVPGLRLNLVPGPGQAPWGLTTNDRNFLEKIARSRARL